MIWLKSTLFLDKDAQHARSGRVFVNLVKGIFKTQQLT